MNALLRQLGYFAAAGVACFYVFVVLKGPNGIPTIQQKRDAIHQLEQRNDVLRQEITKLKDDIDRLDNSSEARDEAIRENTNKVRDRETVIYLPEGSSAPSRQ